MSSQATGSVKDSEDAVTGVFVCGRLSGYKTAAYGNEEPSCGARPVASVFEDVWEHYCWMYDNGVGGFDEETGRILGAAGGAYVASRTGFASERFDASEFDVFEDEVFSLPVVFVSDEAFIESVSKASSLLNFVERIASRDAGSAVMDSKDTGAANAYL